MARDPTIEAYLAEGADWDRDRVLMMHASARRAWLVAGAGWLAALLASAALLALAPLKTVVPFLVRVDNTTGIVDVVPILRTGADFPETATRFLLTHYVTVCERFNFSTAQSDYEECGAFQSAALQQEWYARWNPANAASPLNRYRDGTELRVAVQSVSFIERGGGLPDLAQVRYTVEQSGGSTAAARVSHWIVTIRYGYVEPAADAKSRRWNPLGFRILSFRPEREAVTEMAAAP